MILRFLMFAAPLALGVYGFIWMTNRPAEDAAPIEEAQIAVRYITVTPQARSLTATGFGRVTPTNAWSAISEVQGRIVSHADNLAEGRIVNAGEVLIEIDRTDYELSIERAKTSVASVIAQIAELDLQEENSKRSLELQERILEVAQADFDRVNSLVESGTSTRSALETAQTALLTQQSATLNLQNTLDLIPAQRSALEASLAAERVSLAEAETLLERTTIVAPFRGRVSSVNVENAQFVRTGDSLVTLEATDAAEIVAEFQPQSFFPVAASLGRPGVFAGGEFDTAMAIDLFREVGVTTTVQLDQMNFETSYPASLERMRGTIAEDTGTLGIVVRVEDPLTVNTQARRPPLNVGTFVSVDITAPAGDPFVSIPRASLRYDDNGGVFVYVASDDDTLEIRPVETGFAFGDQISIESGLSAGDRLILSDPRPPIPGLKLIPVSTDKAE